MSDRVTLRDLYTLVDDRFNQFEEKIDKRFEKVEERTSILEHFQDNLTGKLAALWFISNLFILLAIDYVKERVFNLRS